MCILLSTCTLDCWRKTANQHALCPATMFNIQTFPSPSRPGVRSRPPRCCSHRRWRFSRRHPNHSLGSPLPPLQVSTQGNLAHTSGNRHECTAQRPPSQQVFNLCTPRMCGGTNFFGLSRTPNGECQPTSAWRVRAEEISACVERSKKRLLFARRRHTNDSLRDLRLSTKAFCISAPLLHCKVHRC